MKNRIPLVILIVICAGLVGVLIWKNNRTADEKAQFQSSIGNYSNQVDKLSSNLDSQRQVNTELENRVKRQTSDLMNLTNAYSQVSSDLQKTSSSLQDTKEQMAKEVAQRDAKIAELESQNQALDERAADLSTSITNLTAQIEDTKRKLAAAEGDKTFLQKELQRLIAEKAELEKKFNDLKLLRAQVTKLKEELSISRRLQWIRDGLFSRMDQKGAQQLMQKGPLSTNVAANRPDYDLNVEIGSDGSVKVLTPPTNAPAATTNSPPSQ